MQVDKRVKDVVFTINNYSDDDIKCITNLPTSYYIFGREVGISGTPHLQGYCELLCRMRFSRLIKLFNKRAHIEPRKGTNTQAIDYCKKDGDFTEEGTPKVMPGQGTRSDILLLIDMAKEKKDDNDIREAMPESYARHYKALDRIRYSLSFKYEGYCRPEVKVYWGPAGSGKSRRVIESEPDIYIVDEDQQLWWDGYYGQEAILFDDFYGGIKYAKILRILDGYKLRLPIKGGFTHKQWKRVYFTSNMHPDHWYKLGMTPALKRRISYIEELKIPEDLPS